jgi:hypothetical protein
MAKTSDNAVVEVENRWLARDTRCLSCAGKHDI